MIGTHFEGNYMKIAKMLSILTSVCVARKLLPKTFGFWQFDENFNFEEM